MVAFALLVSGGTPAYAWSYPAALNTNAATDSGGDGRPQVTTAGGGNWVAVWHSSEDLFDPNLGGSIGTDGDILVARSTDNGVTWTAPAALNTNAATDTGDDGDPQVTTDGAGNWVAVWSSTEPNVGSGIGTDGDILVARSTDNGVTWTAPTALNTNAATDSALDQIPQVTTDGAGNWVAVWNSPEPNVGSGIGTDYDILVARSTDNGVTWTAPAALNTNAATDSGGDHMCQVTTDNGGNWAAVWFSAEPNVGSGIGADFDILVARSTDNGLTWTAPAALNTNAASDSGVDWYPQVTTDGAGNWVSVWSSDENLGGIGTDDDILVARSIDNGVTWTAPAALNTNAATDSGRDLPPNVTTDGRGDWVAVWYSNENLGGDIETDCDVLLSRSVDNGVTWTAPAALNTNAATDSGDDYHPQMTTDGAGNWLAVWHSWENLHGDIGTDADILYATEVWPAAPVGGIAELPDVSESAGRNYTALAALAAAAVAALSAGAWYARRRWLA